MPPPDDYDDNPEWTEEDFARAQPASEVLPPAVVSALTRKPGRPKGSLSSTKTQVTLRFDTDVLDSFKATRTGWQSRINGGLRRVTP